MSQANINSTELLLNDESAIENTIKIIRKINFTQLIINLIFGILFLLVNLKSREMCGILANFNFIFSLFLLFFVILIIISIICTYKFKQFLIRLFLSIPEPLAEFFASCIVILSITPIILLIIERNFDPICYPNNLVTIIYTSFLYAFFIFFSFFRIQQH